MLIALEVLPVALIQRHFAYLGLGSILHYTSRQRLMRKVRRMVEDGELSRDQLHGLLIDFFESGSKRVYLFRPPVDLSPTVSNLPQQIGDLANAPLVTSSARPRHVYSLVTASALRLSFIESHTDWLKDIQAERLIRQDLPRRAVFQLQRITGESSLALDPPGDVNPHGSALAYYNYYRDRVQTLLGIPFDPLLLHDALSNIDAHDITVMKFLSSRSGDASTFTVSNETEVRTSQPFASASATIVERSAARLHWKTGIVCETTDGPVSLQRSVRTDVDADAGSVRFNSETLSSEIAYVLAQLRAHL